jgi:hypothetical protein
LDIWPPLPIVVYLYSDETWGADNIVAALEHNDRICEMGLFGIQSSQFEKVLATMQQPFPALTILRLGFKDEAVPVDPDLFLGGSAPRLQMLSLNFIPFPGLPKLLLSSTHLVELYLLEIPHSGYISPEAMATCLTASTRLERFEFEFKSPRSRPDQKSRRPHPQTRTLLPVLTSLVFKGVSEYLEDFVVRIDAPLLRDFVIVFFHQLILDTPLLAQFISRTPKFNSHNEARVVFSDRDVRVTLPQTFGGTLHWGISCRQSDWQLSSLAQICSSSFSQALIPAVEQLYVLETEDSHSRLRWQDDIESSQWLELLHPFTAVKALYMSQEFAPRVAIALQELVGERVTEVLPALQTLFLEEVHPSGPVQEATGKFVAARQLAGHPIAASHWKRE